MVARRDVILRSFTFRSEALDLHQAVKWRLIQQNPCQSVDLPKQAKGEIQVLDPQQPRVFLKEAAGDRYHVLFAVALTTGMRPRANTLC